MLLGVEFESPRVGCWGSGGGQGGSGVSPEPVSEGGLREAGPVTPIFSPLPPPPSPLCVSEAPRFESIMEDVEVGAGETARFAVVVEGKPLPDIMWYKVRG